ncbi:MAG TPA: hypothetical protein VFO83_02725, partial [Aggregicoccus sp.]|nr:hypothetical protein [Aggregicoccus sp.]
LLGLGLLLAGALYAAPPSQRTPAAGAEGAVRARYVEGDLDAALALARDEGLSGLAQQLAAVRDGWLAGERRLQAGDPEAARALLDAALQQDAALAPAGGPLALELRQRLSRVHAALATRHLAAGARAAAEQSLRTALQLDARNREARAALDRLQAR